MKPIKSILSTLSVAILVFAASSHSGEKQTPAPAPKEDPNLILDMNAYWRFYMIGGAARIDQTILKNEGENYLEASQLKRMESGVRRSARKRKEKIDDWTTRIKYPTTFRRSYALLNHTRTKLPSNDWMKPEFDDLDWSRIKQPFKMGPRFSADGLVDRYYNIQTVLYRTTFEIPDPRKAGDLEFTMTFRGGARVFVNGEEVGRAFMPDGDVTWDTPAVGYPAEAYTCKPEELPGGKLSDRQMKRAKASKAKPEHYLVPSIRGSFDEQPKPDLKRYPHLKGYRNALGVGFNFRVPLNRAGWERIQNLRDRKIKVTIPASKLNKGTNLLAIDLREPLLHPLALGWYVQWQGNAMWDTGWILDMALKKKNGGDVPSALKRPAGIQIWAEDVHNRAFAQEFYPPGEIPRKARIVAAANGSFGAQIFVGTDRELKNLKATVGEFKGKAGTLPPTIANVLYGVPHTADQLRSLGEGKGGGMSSRPGACQATPIIVNRYFDRDTVRAAYRDRREGRAKLLRKLSFFDHLSASSPEIVPADSAQTIWIATQLPAKAKPGSYTAPVTVTADGIKPQVINLELEVLDWRLPNAKDFRTVMALEQSPYSVIKHYKCEPWSDEHFRLLEGSFKQLARVGCDFLGIPILINSEFGNKEVMPFKVTRKKSGEFLFDFTDMDRYIDLAIKHIGVPQCICFIASHAAGARVKESIKVFDEATGKTEIVRVDKGVESGERRRLWRMLASGIYLHMKKRGLHRTMHWGLIWDAERDESTQFLLKEFAPDVSWVRYSHAYSPNDLFSWCATVRGGGLYITNHSRKGWKAKRTNLWISRSWNDVGTCYGTSLPYAYRVGTERSLCGGARGIGRMGADYWLSTWLDGNKYSGFMTGMPCLSLLWPGKDGAEPSVRFEALLEGLQETEARIFLEQSLEKLNDEALTTRINKILKFHFDNTLFMPSLAPHPKLEEHASGWQERSRMLYEAAAELAEKIGVDFEKNNIDREIPSLGKTIVDLKLRNWTSTPRAWSVAADQDWIQLEKPEGSATPGQQIFKVTLDPAQLEAGKPAEGKLTLTDTKSGRKEEVIFKVNVTPVFTLVSPDPVSNVTVGESESLAYTFMNRSAVPYEWSMKPSLPWIKAEPAAGRLGPAEQCGIKITVSPSDKERVRHDAILKLTTSSGHSTEEKLTVHVLPSYTPPEGPPAGTAQPLQECPKDLFKMGKDHKGRPIFPISFWDPKNPKKKPYQYWPTRKYGLSIGAKVGKDKKGRPTYSPLKTYEKGFGCTPGHSVTLNLEGKNISAFSVEVGYLYGSILGPSRPNMHFEIYVDGKCAIQSHLMTSRDPARLLVVKGLENAKQLTMKTRLHTDKRSAPGRKVYLYGAWADPTVYKNGSQLGAK